MSSSREVTPEAAALGIAIRVKRKELGLSRSDLAERAEISESMVSKIEQGRAKPSANNATKLAHALDTDVADLYAQSVVNEQSFWKEGRLPDIRWDTFFAWTARSPQSKSAPPTEWDDKRFYSSGDKQPHAEDWTSGTPSSAPSESSLENRISVLLVRNELKARIDRIPDDDILQFLAQSDPADLLQRPDTHAR